MQGRDFLALAREVVQGGTERHWRGAAGRAYYALILECRDAFLRWGFTIPRQENVHTFIRLRFSFAADVDLKTIGDALERLCRLRNKADYNLSALKEFSSDKDARKAIQQAADALALLDAIEADPPRRAAAVAAIRAAFP